MDQNALRRPPSAPQKELTAARIPLDSAILRTSSSSAQIMPIAASTREGGVRAIAVIEAMPTDIQYSISQPGGTIASRISKFTVAKAHAYKIVLNSGNPYALY